MTSFYETRSQPSQLVCQTFDVGFQAMTILEYVSFWETKKKIPTVNVGPIQN